MRTPASELDHPRGGAEERPLGRASRAATKAALEGHVAVLRGTPMRDAIRDVLLAAPSLGGKERRFVAFAVRELSRHMRLLDLLARAHGCPPGSLSLDEDRALLRYALWRRDFTKTLPERILAEVKLPGPVRPRSIPDAVLESLLGKQVSIDFGTTALEQAATRHSFPTWLAEAIHRAAPDGELEAVLASLNREPTLTLRARPPGTRSELLAKLAEGGISVEPCSELPDALRLASESRAVFETRWMKEGRLQVMDLGSQLLAAHCQAADGQTVVDFCAGAGGKTIALADAVGSRGRVYAWDISPRRLAEARRRVESLKLRQVSFPREPRLDRADVVLVDAPCSGTGTLAREPDQKWRLSMSAVHDFSRRQQSLLEDVAARLTGDRSVALVYGTCSLLREENEQVIRRFLDDHPRFELESEIRVWPHRTISGGYYAARLVRQPGRPGRR